MPSSAASAGFFDAETPHPGIRPPEGFRLEPEFHPAFASYQKDPSRRNAGALLKATGPILDTGVKAYGGPNANPMLRSHAKKIALEAFKTYDPARASMKTHLIGQLKGLNRYAARQVQMIKVPERVAIDRRRLDEAESELSDRTGRAPSSAEVADATGMPLRRQAYVRGYRPGFAEGQVQALGAGEEDEGTEPAVEAPDATAHRLEFLYPDLDPIDQAIVEHGYGLHGRKRLRPGQVASTLNLSAGAISQRAGRIQRQLDELEDRRAF